MYEMIIIDDELVIRDGICTLVDWEKIGFHIAAVLPDGEAGLSFLARYPVDVVLTDLRMGAVSGLDIARYIFENQIPAKVVILSGHSDFEAARKALEYKVDTFLLKPISIKRIKETFTRVAQELDKRQKLQAAKEMEIATVDSYLEECFMEEIRYGTLRDEARLARSLKRLGWEALAQKACGLLTIQVEDFKAALLDFDDHVDDMAQCIWAHMQRLGQVYPVSRQDGRFTGLWLNAGEGRSLCEESLGQLGALTGMHLRLAAFLPFDSLYQLLAAWNAAWFAPCEEITLAELRARQQLVIAHLAQEDTGSAKAHAMAFLSQWTDRADHVHDAAMDFLAGLVEHTRISGKDVMGETVFPYGGLMAARSPQELLEAASLLLDEWIRRAGAMKRINKKQLVDGAIEYIAAHIHGALSLEGAAEHVFISPVYLSRIFKEVTGVNFKQYIIDLRIAHAAKALIDTEEPVYAICHGIGYRDIKHFYTLFARKMGCTPQEYRTRARQGMRGGKEP